MSKLISAIFYITVLTGLVFYTQSCEPPDPVKPLNPEELITTLQLTFVNTTASTDSVILYFKDLDGDGGNAPINTVKGKFKVGKKYSGKLTILNESKTPADVISDEVKEEAADHQVFYIEKSSSTIFKTLTYKDSDSHDKPLGLEIEIEVSTTASSNGILQVVLRHKPDKNATFVSLGKIDNAGGETDIDVSFDIASE